MKTTAQWFIVLLTLPALGCAASAFDQAGVPTPQPTPSLTEVDLLISPNATTGLPPQLRTVSAAETLAGSLDIELVDGVSVTGVVGVANDPDPIPLAEGAQVRAVGVGASESRLEVTTDADLLTGEYELILAPGDYDIIVTPRGASPTRPVVTFAAITIETTTQLDLPLSDPFIVQGTIRDDGGIAVAGDWRVTAYNDDLSGQPQAALTDTNGFFTIALPDNALHTFRVTPPAGAIGYPTVEIHDVDVTSGSFNYDYPAGYPAGVLTALSGSVRVAASPPLPNFATMQVTAVGALPAIPARPNEVYTYTISGGVTPQVETADFLLEVPPGNYAVQIVPELGDPYSHQLVTSITVQTTPVVLDTLDTTLAPKATLLGVVSDTTGRAIAGARVIYTASDFSGYLFLDVSDSAGLYSLMVNEGPYGVVVLPRPDSGLVRIETTNAVGQSNQIDHELAFGTILDGLITDPVSAPVDATVTVLDPTTGNRIGSDKAFTNPDGSYAVTAPTLLQ